MDNSVIAKSGWLYRKGLDTAWEKNWVELYRDGYLKYYESDYSPNAEETIFMPTECIAIKTGLQVKSDGIIKPPDNHSHACIFSVSGSGNKLWIFCGETLDDMRAWQLALEQSRLLITRNHFQNTAGMGNPFLRHHYPPFPLPSMSPYSPFGLGTNYIPAFTDGSLTFVPPHRASAITSTTSSTNNSGPGIRAPSATYPNYQPVSGFPGGNPSSSFYPISYGSHPLSSVYSHQSSTSTSASPSLVTQSPGSPYTRPDSRDLAMGMLAGAAVGTMMWGPYLWW